MRDIPEQPSNRSSKAHVAIPSEQSIEEQIKQVVKQAAAKVIGSRIIGKMDKFAAVTYYSPNTPEEQAEFIARMVEPNIYKLVDKATREAVIAEFNALSRADLGDKTLGGLLTSRGLDYLTDRIEELSNKEVRKWDEEIESLIKKTAGGSGHEDWFMELQAGIKNLMESQRK